MNVASVTLAAFAPMAPEAPAAEPQHVRRIGSSIDVSSIVQHTELDETNEPLAGRPKRIWTGGGYLQRSLFQGELLARVRGRLTHYGDRVDEDGNSVIDMWLTDVILEGAIGDAVVFYRFHDLLDRADEVEPGIRFPGFSRMYGVSWRFWG